MNLYTRFLPVAIVFSLFYACNNPQKTSGFEQIPDRKWWKEAVVYQIYPRSFKDSNGDGVGDLRGIISELDYIKSLGIDVVWLNPVYASPNKDNGYDISDYRSINPKFGTMEDFDALLKGMHDRGIKVMMDMVLNHCSEEHEWFKGARSSRDNPYRDYFHWWPAEKGKPTPRFSFFDVKGDAWKYDSLTNSYYLHYFGDFQPDLNWENPKLRQEVYTMMRYWLDKGIDGLRMDAFQYISKDTTFPAFPPGYEKTIAKYYNGPTLHNHIQELNREVLSKYDIMTVAEGAGSTLDEAMLFVDPDRKELNMAYHFEGVDFGYVPGEFKVPDPNGLNLPGMKAIYAKWDQHFEKKGWLSIYLANHDQPRMLTRWGNDTPQYREYSAKLLNTFLLSMRGTPYYYFGDEIGMSNIKFDKIEDYKDVETLNMYQKAQAAGKDLTKFIEAQKISARDNGRTPMQWNTTVHSGFTTGTPWLKVNPNYDNINVAVQNSDSKSILNHFRQMVQLRKSEPALVYGKFTLLQPENKRIFAYTRELEGRKLLVLMNFSDQRVATDTGMNIAKSKVLISNYPDKMEGRELRPYEALILELF